MPETLDLDALEASATAGETTTAEPTADKAEPTADKTEPAEAATEETAETPDDDFLGFVRDEFGEDLTSQFGDGREAIKSLLEARRLVGRRDDDASYGRALRQLLSGKEQQLQAFLSGQTAPKTTPKKTRRELEDFPDDAANWRYQIVENEGKYTPAPGAPATVVDDYRDYLAARERRLDQIARNWSKVEKLPEEIQQQLQTRDTVTATERETQAVNDIQNRYKEVLFVGGEANGALTPHGKKVDAEYRRLQTRYPQAGPATWFEDAIRNTLGDGKAAPKPGAAKPGAKALRQPGVAQEDAAVYKDIEDEINQRMRKGEDMDKILLEIHSREQGGKLG